MNVYKKLSVKKQSAKPGDLLSAVNKKKMSQRKVLASKGLSKKVKALI